MELAQRRQHLSAAMEAAGAWPARAPWIREAMEDLPRDHFAPDDLWYWTGSRYEQVSQAADPARWAQLVYAGPYDTTITQLTDGRPSCSLSCESIVADMLDVLLLEPGHQVLELGTGTGRNAALLARRAGPGRVRSVEADPELAAGARARLRRIGADAAVHVADGNGGHPNTAPYDRVLATYAVERVPWAWVAQTRPGGRIVLPWGRLGHVALTVADDGRSATGWMQGLAAFMADRGAPPAKPPAELPEDRPDEAPFDRDVRPLQEDVGLRFALRVALPEVQISAQDREGRTLHVHDGASSWAVISQPAAGPAQARQAGPRRLADEVERAWRWWEEQGTPHVYDFGLTVTPDSQHVWCRDPGSGPSWPE